MRDNISILSNIKEQKAQAPRSAPTSAGGPTGEVVLWLHLSGPKRLEGLGAGAGLRKLHVVIHT